jgi:hypothetical protein
MASPEALLLRHRMHATNICQKVTRSRFRRLFKIGHLCSYFLLNFYTDTLRWPQRKAIRTNQFQNGTLARQPGAIATTSYQTSRS